jgi:uncharacterized Fe-S cluster-containing protein
MMIPTKTVLPNLNCGLCGYRRCDDLAAQLDTQPDLIQRCIHLSENRVQARATAARLQSSPVCGTCLPMAAAEPTWKDTLGRDFDFYLEHFPEEPGPREIILPHNPLLTRELDLLPGDILIGRPLGMSCGCPITHCGIVMEADHKTGVVVWCVTGPLNPRQKGFKDLGYYIAEGYEGLITQTRAELKIGMRYYFQPRMCMLQWRHSGLVNYLTRTASGYQVRLEGLWIG